MHTTEFQRSCGALRPNAATTFSLSFRRLFCLSYPAVLIATQVAIAAIIANASNDAPTGQTNHEPQIMGQHGTIGKIPAHGPKMGQSTKTTTSWEEGDNQRKSQLVGQGEFPFLLCV